MKGDYVRLKDDPNGFSYKVIEEGQTHVLANIGGHPVKIKKSECKIVEVK